MPQAKPTKPEPVDGCSAQVPWLVSGRRAIEVTLQNPGHAQPQERSQAILRRIGTAGATSEQRCICCSLASVGVVFLRPVDESVFGDAADGPWLPRA